MSTGLDENLDIKGSMISRNIHDQGESYLCWVYAFATSFSNAVKILVNSLNKRRLITNGQKKKCEERMNEPNFHRRLRNEICMVIPTSIKDGQDQSIRVRLAMLRVPYSTDPLI